MSYGILFSLAWQKNHRHPGQKTSSSRPNNIVIPAKKTSSSRPKKHRHPGQKKIVIPATEPGSPNKSDSAQIAFS
jgi:hypothetical protein